MDAAGKLGLYAGMVALLYYSVHLVFKPKRWLWRVAILVGLGLLAFGVWKGANKVFASWRAILDVGFAIAAVSSAFIAARYKKRILNLRAENDSEQLRVKSIELQVAALKRPIAVFVPRSRSAQGTFWLEFLSCVGQDLQVKNYSYRFQYLNNDYSAPEQVSQLKGYEWSSVSGAIVSLADATVLPELTRLLEGFGTSGPSVVLHDLAPEVALRYFAQAKVAANLVCIDNECGGEIAADIMVDALQARGIQPPYNIVLVPGSNEHPHSRLRLSGFQNQLAKRAQPVKVMTTTYADWTNSGAAHAIRLFMQTDEGKKVGCVHGVFACNDDMALGIEDIVLHSRERNFAALNRTAIVGFDFTHALQNVWSSHRPGLVVGTVNAMLHEQSVSAVDLVIDLIEGRQGLHTQRNIEPRRVMRPGGVI